MRSLHGNLIALLTGMVLAVSLMFLAPSARAERSVDIEDVLRTLEQLQDTIQKQNAEIERLKKALLEVQQKQESAQETQEHMIQTQVKKEVEEQTKPMAWAKRVKLSGDLRLRYEGIYNREKDGEDVEDRNRFRVRLRLYGDAKLSEEIAAHYMLSTSDTQFGQTSNQTLKEEFDNKAIFIARAWGDYRPGWLPGLEVGFGKFKNPYVHSDISFDPDVNPEGFYELYTCRRWEAVRPFVKLGQLLISENDFTKDAALFLWQGGVEIRTEPVTVTLAGSFYDYTNLDRTRLGESKRAKGNSTVPDPETGSPILAYDFQIAEAIGSAEFKLWTIPATVWGDYLKNTADGVPDDRNTAWGAGIDLGALKIPGDWKFEYMYKSIESDAVLGLFADGDFFGTNREGHRWRFSYRLLTPLTFQLAFFETDSIEGENHENRFQVSTILKF